MAQLPEPGSTFAEKYVIESELGRGAAGVVLSAMHTGLPAEAVDAIAAKHPLGLGSAQDLVGAYSYLASDASRWTTGSAIVVDGGYAAP